MIDSVTKLPQTDNYYIEKVIIHLKDEFLNNKRASWFHILTICGTK